MKDAKAFFFKGLALLLSFYLLTLAANTVFTRVVNWRAWQDPRKRLLWDDVDPAAYIIILGDSAFISGHVSTEDQTLWRVLEQQTGRRVFNGALDGADPADFINAGKLLPRADGAGKMILLDIIPDRFIQNGAPEQEAGNYASQFSRRLGDSLPRRLLVSLMQPLRILDLDILMNVAMRKRFFGTKDYPDSAWFSDTGRAAEKFRTFEKYWIETAGLKSFSWLDTLQSISKEKGYRLTLVLMPVNNALLNKYARMHRPSSYEIKMAAAHHALLGYLNEKGFSYIDAYDGFTSDEFADLIHFNSRGDRHLAKFISGHLTGEIQAASSSVSRAAQMAGR